MNPTLPLSDEGRRFFIQQAKQFQQSNQPVTLETNTAHSVITGRVNEVQEGGLVFQQSDTNSRICVPWEKVDKLTAIGQPGEQNAGRAYAGSSQGSQQRY